MSTDVCTDATPLDDLARALDEAAERARLPDGLQFTEFPIDYPVLAPWFFHRVTYEA